MARLLEREITVLSILSSEACCFRGGKKNAKEKSSYKLGIVSWRTRVYGKLRAHETGINYTFDACRERRININATCAHVMHNRADGTREISSDDGKRERSGWNTFQSEDHRNSLIVFY